MVAVVPERDEVPQEQGVEPTLGTLRRSVCPVDQIFRHGRHGHDLAGGGIAATDLALGPEPTPPALEILHPLHGAMEFGGAEVRDDAACGSEGPERALGECDLHLSCRR